MAELGAIGAGPELATGRTSAQGPGAAQANLMVIDGQPYEFNVPVTNPRVILGAFDSGQAGAAPPQGVPYFVSGMVKENDVPVRRLVRVYDRATGRLLNEEYSDGGSGRFYIVVENQTSAVYIVAFDDTGVGDDFNAQIYDLVIAMR